MQTQRTGAFTKTALWIIASPLILLVLTSLLSESADAHARHNVAYASVAALKARLAFPKTFKADTVRVTDAGATCIQYRARDGFGTLDQEQAVVVDGSVTQSGKRDGRFRLAWDRQCLGQSYDVTEAVVRFF
jgi:hypothetical protein